MSDTPMPASSKQTRIDELIDKAAVALSHEHPFEAERLSHRALIMSRQINDFARMAESIGPLRNARHIRREEALTARKVNIITETVTEKVSVKPGCFLVQPPQVGADARRLRLAALQAEIPIAVVCREPLTQTGLWPIVAIGAGMTIRTKIKPPRNPNKPDMKWFTGAMEAIGDWALDIIDSDIDLIKRIDVLLERLDTVPDHERLHDELEQACREAGNEPATKSKSKTSMKS